MPAFVKRNGYEGHMYRLALNYAIEPEAPKAQTPSSTCPFIIINYVKEQTIEKSDPQPARASDRSPYLFGD
jgi:hypothetical protein